MRLRAGLLGLLALPLALLAAGEGDVVVPGESKSAPGRFVAVRKSLAEKKYAEAAAALSALAERGTDLVPLPEGRFLQSRLEAQRLLSRMPPRTLASHRRRSEPQAKKLLDQADQESDPSLLVRVVEEAFCTRAAMTALDRLGDLAFERGRFAEAELWWRTLSPLGGRTDDDGLVYPDPPPESAARAQAKQVLARLFAGRAGFDADLLVYRRTHPKAVGNLAGRKGAYADTLQAVARERAARPAPEAGDWTTFGGDPSRQAVVPAGERFLDRVSQLGRGGPAWRFDLESRKRLDGPLEGLKGREVDVARRLAFHPVVVGDLALVADARYVTAYHLDTGKVETWFDVEDQVGGVKTTLSTPTIPDLRYTLTVSGDAVFARLGSQAVRDVRPDPKTKKAAEGGESVLVSLSLKAKEGARKRWMVRAIDPGRGEYALFEGAPLAAAGRVWIAASRFEGDRVVTAVHCYPAEPEDTAPLPLWRTDVCQTRELLPAGGEESSLQRRHRHHLLTLAGPRVLYCSHSGVVAALDAATGRQVWALKYPRRDVREPEDEPALRDLAPCLFAEGRVYAAPADSDFLYCLEPMTGRVIWRRERTEPVALLGVGKGKLIFTTYRNPRQGSLHAGGLRAVDAETGGDAGGWQLPDDGGGLTPLGRGLLVGDLVLWPTARRPCGVVAVRQEDGRQPDNPALLHRIPSGNLVFANGSLLVTDQRTMWAFVPPEKLPDEDDQAARRDARPMLRRARAAAARKEREKAVGCYDAVLKMAGEPPRYLAEARHERQAVLLDAAADAAERKKPGEAEKWLTLAAKGAAGSEKLAALVGAAEVWEKAGDAARGLKAWRLVAGEGGLVEDEQGRPQRAKLVAKRRIAALEKSPPKDRPPLKAEASESAPVVLPLRASPSVTLPEGERFLPFAEGGGPAASAVWSYSRKGELVCRSREGLERWRCRLGFEPSWLGAAGGDRIIAAGARGVAALGAKTGERYWVFDAPAERLVPRSISSLHVPRDTVPGGDLGDFTLAGGLLIFTQGGHVLLGLDLLDGEVAWQRRPIDAGLGLPEPYGRVHHLLPLGDVFLAQVSGRRSLCNVATGRVTAEARDEVAAWPRPPLRVKDAVYLVAEAGRVERVDPPSPQPRWTYRPPGKSTRTGGPPVLVAGSDSLVAIVPENVGLRLVGLDPDKGVARWSRLVEGDPDRLAPHAWAADGRHLYHAGPGALRAWSLVDGKPAWECPLPGEHPWRLACSGSVLLAWPAAVDALSFEYRGLGGALQWRMGPWPGPDAVLPLLCLDPADGGLIQRLNLPADRPTDRATRLPLRRGLFPSFTAGIAPDDGPTVRLDRQGLLFALARQVRVFENDRRE